VLRARRTLGVVLGSFPHVVDWVERLRERPAVAAELDVVDGLAVR
jgi:glutathione S-transferase